MPDVHVRLAVLREGKPSYHHPFSFQNMFTSVREATLDSLLVRFLDLHFGKYVVEFQRASRLL